MDLKRVQSCIAKERKMQEGIERLVEQLTHEEHRDKRDATTMFLESGRRLEFLLDLVKNSNNSFSLNLNTLNAENSMNNYLSTVPFTLPLLIHRLSHIKHKIEVENRVLTGIEKMLNGINPDSKNKHYAELSDKISECKLRIVYLKRADSDLMALLDGVLDEEKKKYLEKGGSGADSGVDFETMRCTYLNAFPLCVHTPISLVSDIRGIRCTGRLQIQPIESLNLFQRRRNSLNFPQTKSPDSLPEDLRVVVRVDGQVKGITSKLSKPVENSQLAKEKWTDLLDIQVDRAVEVEIAVYDMATNKSSNESNNLVGGTLLGMVWFRIIDLDRDLKEKRKDSNFDGNIDNTKEVWLDLVPGGRICTKLNYTSVTRVKSEKNFVYRSDGVAKIHPINGHKFGAAVYYQVMNCGVCNEMFLGSGYSCENCQFFCHPKCYDRVFFTCAKDLRKNTTSTNVVSSTAKFVKYNIPHRYKESPCLTPTWCNHCGYLVTLGRKVLTCQECNFSVHPDHSSMVPPYCGLKWESQAQIVAAMEEEVARKELEEADRVRKEWEEQARKTAIEADRLTQGLELTYLTPKPVARVEIAAPVTVQDAQTPPKKSKRTVVTLQDFKFISVLGRGSFGKVMLAEDLLSGRLYAIKALKKEFVVQNDDVKGTHLEKRIFQAASATMHPYLVNLHSCFHTDTRIYFVMEYVSGGDLMAHIQALSRKSRGQPVGFDPARTKFYACEILLALEYFHKNDIMYRDLKLENILLTADGHIKLADYGICKEKMSYGARTRSFCGTPEYMAPEVLLHERYGRAVDWWSYGVLIYVMTVGKYPFPGDDENYILDAILAEAIEYPSNMSKTTLSLIQALLNKSASRRLGGGRQDAEEIKKHPYFANVNWDLFMQKKVTPPWAPTLKSPTDTSNFSTEYTRERPLLTHVESNLSRQQQNEFNDFAYVSPWAQDWL
ncbi:Serine/threonine kinase [Nowakowskiella sp. JEL0407]|nr:Serine/threonine kinase [Nowakowskiella sp. JEL0407]